jgi:hypothetical protein
MSAAPRRSAARCSILAALIFVALPGNALADQEPAVRIIDAGTPVTLTPGASKDVELANDSTNTFSVTGSVSFAPTGNKAAANAPAVSVAFEGAAGPSASNPAGTLGSAGLLRLHLSASRDAGPGESGWLTVVARSDKQTVVARREIQIATPTPAITTWTVTSVQSTPWAEGGGNIGPPLPLSTQAGCAALGNPSTVLVSGDHTVKITSTCAHSNLQLKASSFPPGTFKGKLTVAGTSVELEVRRTVALWAPILLIIAGVVLAMISQGRVEQGWRAQQRLWLRRLPHRAAKADAQYIVAATEMPWENYALEPVIEREVQVDRERSRLVAESLPLLLRLLPWPEGFRATEREVIRKSIAEMDKLVTEWPTVPAVFAAANTALRAKPYYVTRAPNLLERGLLIVGGAEPPVTVSELASRVMEAKDMPAALAVVDDLDKLDQYLDALEGDDIQRPPQDTDAMVRARQYEREAAATLAELANATKIPDEVGRLVERGTRLAARLPKPVPAAVEEGIDRIKVETASASGVLGLALGFIQRVSGSLDAPSFYLGRSTLIMLDLAVGVLTGLAALYLGNAWGGSWTEYVAAVIWGYGASTVTSPIVAAVRQLGARPGDETAGTAPTK